MQSRLKDILPLMTIAVLSSVPFALAQSDVTNEAPNVMTAKPAGMVEAVLFYLFAATTIVSALGVCTCKNVVRMAVWLFCTLSSVAVMYFLLAAPFLGAVQLIVYVGGTLILLIFGVMLTGKSPWLRFDIKRGEMIASGVVCLSLFIALSMLLARADWSTSATGVKAGVTVEEIGRVLLSKYVVPFEAAGVLLFIVMVGAAHLARQEKK